MSTSQIYTTHKDQVICQGDFDGDHPKVYLKTYPPHPTKCPYCGKAFEKASS